MQKWENRSHKYLKNANYWYFLISSSFTVYYLNREYHVITSLLQYLGLFMDHLGFEIQKEIVKIDLSDSQYCALCFSVTLLGMLALGYIFINNEDIRLENLAQSNQAKNGVDIISTEEFEYNKK